ncbi:MAG: hypothetical protein ACTSU2_02915 [Promethearchaeota archaeon]
MIDIGSWIIFASIMLLFIIFLFYDLLGRDEPYGNLAYIVAIMPVDYLWYKITLPENINEYKDFGVTGVWAFLLTLWFICMIRDMIKIRMKKQDFDDTVMYLMIGIIVQLILSAILPHNNVIPSMQAYYGSASPIPDIKSAPQDFGTSLIWFFYLPNIWNATPLILNYFRIIMTLLILGVITPMLMDIKGEQYNLFVLLIITGIFMLPFTLICWLWLPEAFLSLLVLVSILFFIILLMITKKK